MHTVAAKSRWLAPIFIVGVLVALGVSDRAVWATFDNGGGVGEISVASNRADLISGGDALVSVDLIARTRERSGSSSTETTSPTRSPSGRTAATRVSSPVSWRARTSCASVPRTESGAGSRSPTTPSAARCSPANDPALAVPDSAPKRHHPRARPWRSMTSPTPPRPWSSTSTAPSPTPGLRTTRTSPPGAGPRSPRRPPTRARPSRSSSSESREPRTAASTRSQFWWIRPSRSRRGRPSSHGTASTSTPSAARAVSTISSRRSATYATQPASGLGFAVGTSSLNTYANSCSDVISAEALMMTKEIVTERWGPIRYTIGDGGSAGTMQQHMISTPTPGC